MKTPIVLVAVPVPPPFKPWRAWHALQVEEISLLMFAAPGGWTLRVVGDVDTKTRFATGNGKGARLVFEGDEGAVPALPGTVKEYMKNLGCSPGEVAVVVREIVGAVGTGAKFADFFATLAADSGAPHADIVAEVAARTGDAAGFMTVLGGALRAMDGALMFPPDAIEVPLFAREANVTSSPTRLVVDTPRSIAPPDEPPSVDLGVTAAAVPSRVPRAVAARLVARFGPPLTDEELREMPRARAEASLAPHTFERWEGLQASA